MQIHIWHFVWLQSSRQSQTISPRIRLVSSNEEGLSSSINIFISRGLYNSWGYYSNRHRSAVSDNIVFISHGDQMFFFQFETNINVLFSISASFNYLCYGSTAITNTLILKMWGSISDVRIWPLKSISALWLKHIFSQHTIKDTWSASNQRWPMPRRLGNVDFDCRDRALW